MTVLGRRAFSCNRGIPVRSPARASVPLSIATTFISQKVSIKSFCESQSPHKSVNLFFTLVIIKNKLTNLCGNWLLQNDCKSTLCEANLRSPARGSVPLSSKCGTYKIIKARLWHRLEPFSVSISLSLPLYLSHSRLDAADPPTRFHLTQCTNHIVLESQLPQKTVNLLFSLKKWTISWQFVGELTF